MAAGPGPTLRIDGVSKRYATSARSAMSYGVREILGELDVRTQGRRPELRANEFWALDDVSLTVEPGQAVGVIGANGAGKTSLLRVVHGLSRPDSGEVVVHGRTGALIDLGISFIPFATGRESMEMEAALLGLEPADRIAAFERIMEFADIGEFIDVPVSKYSLGMRMRLGYAIVAALEPQLLLIDEVLSVGDIGFQRKCLNFVSSYVERGGSVLLVTHDLWAVRMVCSRCIVLDHGRIVADGDVDDTITTYLTDFLAIGEHADTATLDRRAIERRTIEPAAVVPVADDVPEGEDVPEADAPAARGASQKVRGSDDADTDDADDEREPVLPVGEIGTAVRVCSATVEGVAAGPPAPLEAATVRIELECATGTPPFVCAFTITANGQMVPLARAELPRHSPVTAVGERIELRAEIAGLPLLGGSYLLRVLVFDPSNGELLGQKGWADEAVPFLVEEPERFVRTLFRIAGVMVKAEVDWSATDAPPDPATAEESRDPAEPTS
jgi:ABC-type polysaccharide/polyol phosphate transport system ATPase subunit